MASSASSCPVDEKVASYSERKIDFSELSVTSSLMSQFLEAEEILETKPAFAVLETRPSIRPGPSDASPPPREQSARENMMEQWHPSKGDSSFASDTESQYSDNVETLTSGIHKEDVSNMQQEWQLPEMTDDDKYIDCKWQHHYQHDTRTDESRQSPFQLQSQMFLSMTLRQLEQATKEKAYLWEQLQRANAQLDETRLALAHSKKGIRVLLQKLRPSTACCNHHPQSHEHNGNAHDGLPCDDRSPRTNSAKRCVSRRQPCPVSLPSEDDKNSMEDRLEDVVLEIPDLLEMPELLALMRQDQTRAAPPTPSEHLPKQLAPLLISDKHDGGSMKTIFLGDGNALSLEDDKEASLDDGNAVSEEVGNSFSTDNGGTISVDDDDAISLDDSICAHLQECHEGEVEALLAYRSKIPNEVETVSSFPVSSAMGNRSLGSSEEEEEEIHRMKMLEKQLQSARRELNAAGSVQSHGLPEKRVSMIGSAMLSPALRSNVSSSSVSSTLGDRCASEFSDGETEELDDIHKLRHLLNAAQRELDAARRIKREESPEEGTSTVGSAMDSNALWRSVSSSPVLSSIGDRSATRSSYGEVEEKELDHTQNLKSQLEPARHELNVDRSISASATTEEDAVNDRSRTDSPALRPSLEQVTYRNEQLERRYRIETQRQLGEARRQLELIRQGNRQLREVKEIDKLIGKHESMGEVHLIQRYIQQLEEQKFSWRPKSQRELQIARLEKQKLLEQRDESDNQLALMEQET